MKCIRRSLLPMLVTSAIAAGVVHAGAQVPMDRNAPAYQQRNQDFQDRRATDKPVNFGKTYYSAHKEIAARASVLSKKVDQWTPRGPFGKEQLAGTGRVNSIQFHPTDTNTWFICVAQGGIWKTTNAGESWLSVSGDLPILRTSRLAIHPLNPDIMYVALGDFAYLGHNLQANENKRNSHYGLGVYKTTDGGNHWFPTGLTFEQEDFEGSLIARILIRNSNPDHILAVGQTGAYLSLDSGVSWTRTSTELFWDLEQDPYTDSILYASTGYVHSYRIGKAAILKSRDFGRTWVASTTPIPPVGKVQRIELAIAPSDNQFIYAIACDSNGGFYGFYKSVNAGSTFTLVTDYTYMYNLLGWRFNQEPGGQGRYDLAICVDRYDKNKILVGGVNMWQTTNGGVSFEPVTYWPLNYQGLGLHADIHQIVQHPVNNSWFACHDGGISRTFKVIPDLPSDLEDGIVSTDWVHYTNGLNITSFYRLSVNQLNPVELIAGAQDNSTVFTDGSAFYNLSGGDGMESLFMDNDYYRYTSSQNGRIYVYTVFGGDMAYEGTIIPPGYEAGEWTTPFVTARNRMYVLYGNLYPAIGSFLSSGISSFPNIPNYSFPKPGTALAMERSNGKHIYLAKRGYNSLKITNEVWASTDGGSNWLDRGSQLPDYLYPSYIEMSQREPEKVWICFSGFDSANKVFYSSDAGNAWTNITYDLPNVPVNCLVHQNDGSDILYAGTDAGVFYLASDTTSWQYYSNNLPKVIVSELEIDTTNKTLVAATFGRGLWEVGLVPYVDTTTSVRDFTDLSFKMEVYPNPAMEYVRIRMDDLNREVVHVKLIDVTGRILDERVISEAGDVSMEMGIGHLKPGEYYVVLSTRQQRAVGRFIKY